MIELTLTDVCLISPPLLLIEGFFSGSEIALLTADKLALKQRAKNGEVGAKLALKVTARPERILSTTLLITNVCVVTQSAILALFCITAGFSNPGLAAVFMTTPLVVVIGELIPKTVFQRNANKLAPYVAYPVVWFYWIFLPLTLLLASYTTQLSRILGVIGSLLPGQQKTTREEIRSLLSFPQKDTDIRNNEKQIIKCILDFKDSEARHALIPLVQIEAIEETATVQTALQSFEMHRHSRMPVFSGRIDNIVGVLEISDLLIANDLQSSIRSYLSVAHYVSETQSLRDLLSEMRHEDNEMVIVVDEHGGAVGILTFEDIVEEIVGEINDEFDFETQAFRELQEGKWSVQARVEIQQLNESLDLELPEGDYETLSGFLLQQFGRIPEPKDELYFDTPSGSYRFVIHKATERHIETVLIQKLTTTEKSSV